MLTRETIQRVKNALRIEDVIGEFLQLKSRGNNLVGYCPFHQSDAPNLTVHPKKGLFFCVECKKGGDAIQFVMQHEHLSEQEATLWLARKYGIDLGEEADDMVSTTEEEQLYDVMQFAQDFFTSRLFDDEMGRAVGLSYFEKRGIFDETIRSFGLGYSPDSSTAFTDVAFAKGYDPELLRKASLVGMSAEGNRCYDFFRGRVTFPIFSITGRVIGFSCRILSSDKTQAKYRNSAETAVYKKGEILYGLYQAKEAIREKDKCYLVEGNLDVVKMHQSGITNSVATCGTALTLEQVRLIRRYTRNVVVVYDGDSAGIKATQRAAQLLFAADMKVSMVLLPDGHDPDSYSEKYGKEGLQNFLANNEQNYVSYYTGLIQKEVAVDPIRKTEEVKNIIQTIALVGDMLERSEYVKILASKMHVSEVSVQNELAKSLDSKRRKAFAQQQSSVLSQQIQGVETLAEGEAGVDSKAEADEANPPAPLFGLNLFPDDAQERKIISLLLNHGADTVKFVGQDEEGKEFTEVSYVSSVIVGEILNDKILFDNELYQRIFDTYSTSLQQEQIPDVSYFIGHEDEQIRTVALELMVVEKSISNRWIEKHISVPDPSKMLKEDVVYSLLTLKLRKIDRSIEDNSRKLRICRDNDEIMMLVAEKMSLTQARQAVCKELNCIYN